MHGPRVWKWKCDMLMRNIEGWMKPTRNCSHVCESHEIILGEHESTIRQTIWIDAFIVFFWGECKWIYNVKSYSTLTLLIFKIFILKYI
jgi:hypothetical protein